MAAPHPAVQQTRSRSNESESRMADENAQGGVDSPSVASSSDGMSWMVDEQEQPAAEAEGEAACAPFQRLELEAATEAALSSAAVVDSTSRWVALGGEEESSAAVAAVVVAHILLYHQVVLVVEAQQQAGLRK